MGVKLIGNRGSYFRGGSADGIGGMNYPDGIIGWVGIVADADGGVIYLSAADVTSNNKVDQGYYFQAVGGSVTVDHTLQNVGLAKNPDPAVQENVAWVAPLSVAPGGIEQSTLGFSALRITFTGVAELYIVAR